MEYKYLEQFEWEEVILKGVKKYTIEGYASTINEDLSQEYVTKSAQMDILDQIKGRLITVDVEHEVWYDDKTGKPISKPNSVIPVARVIDAELREKGVWIKCEFNESAPKFKNVWDSIVNGFVHSFSVAFYPVEAVRRKVGDGIKSFVNRLNLVNITLTGNPCNPEARFTPVMKTISDEFNTNSFIDKSEETNMSEVETKTAESEIINITETDANIKVQAPENPEKESEKAKDTEADDNVKDDEEDEDKKAKKKAIEELAILKKQNEELELKLKSLTEKVNVLEKTPVMKAIQEPMVITKENAKEFDIFKYIK